LLCHLIADYAAFGTADALTTAVGQLQNRFHILSILP
jgi:hypothetical protein